MEIKDILALVNAGFTKDEITALTAAKEPETPVVEVPVEQIQQPESTELTLEDVLKELKDLKESVHKKNIISDSKEPEKTESAEDILIKILNGKEKTK